jgi:hypothetical protein
MKNLHYFRCYKFHTNALVNQPCAICIHQRLAEPWNYYIDGRWQREQATMSVNYSTAQQLHSTDNVRHVQCTYRPHPRYFHNSNPHIRVHKMSPVICTYPHSVRRWSRYSHWSRSTKQNRITLEAFKRTSAFASWNKHVHFLEGMAEGKLCYSQSQMSMY